MLVDRGIGNDCVVSTIRKRAKGSSCEYEARNVDSLGMDDRSPDDRVGNSLGLGLHCEAWKVVTWNCPRSDDQYSASRISPSPFA